MKSRTIIPLAVGLFAGLVAVKFGLDAIKKARGSVRPAEQLTVVTADMDIRATAEIVPDMITVLQTPRTPLLGKGNFEDPEKVIGRVAAKSIPRGTPITESMLASPGTRPGINVKIREGFRAVSVKTDEVSGVAYKLKPGDFVDVIAVMDVRNGNRNETVSRLILQRVEVAAVGQEVRSGKEAEARTRRAQTVTLLVRDIDVPRLHLAQTRGRVTLALRGADDTSIAEESTTSESDLHHLRPELAHNVARPTPSSTDAAPDGAGVTQAITPQKPFAVTVFNGTAQRLQDAPPLVVLYRSIESMSVMADGAGRAAGQRLLYSAPSTDPFGSDFSGSGRAKRRRTANGAQSAPDPTKPDPNKLAGDKEVTE